MVLSKFLAAASSAVGSTLMFTLAEPAVMASLSTGPLELPGATKAEEGAAIRELIQSVEASLSTGSCSATILPAVSP